MEENKHKHVETPASTPKPWKGYTLEELEHRRAINTVKSSLLKEQMYLAYSMTSLASSSSTDSLSTMGNGMSKIMTVVSYGTQAFKYARSVFSMISRFRNMLK